MLLQRGGIDRLIVFSTVVSRVILGLKGDETPHNDGLI
jgi:hypothetical protein